MKAFADRFIDRARGLGHPLCVGLDPYLDRIPPTFRRGDMSPLAGDTVAAVREFLLSVLDIVSDLVCIVKPQAAFFEQLGWRGIELLELVVNAAHERGLLVILDGKRGDIAEVAAGYAQGYLMNDSPISVDAITVTPYLGLDAIEPFVRAAEAHGRGVVVLVRNSNPGSGRYQTLVTDSGRTVFEEVAASLRPIEDRLLGDTWSSLTVTAAATYGADTDSIRAQLPRSLLLVPGLGAQGGTIPNALRGFARGPSGLEGGIINCSRTILFPDDAFVDDRATWRRAVTRAARAMSEKLRLAVGA